MYIQVYPFSISNGMSMNDSYILVLDAPDIKKQVPILIGESEAQAIILAIEQKETQRPLTHALICNLMEEYMLSLKRVTIDRFDEGIFYATLHMSDGFTEKPIDARASDAVVLALLEHCDILMDMNVLNETSMDPGALTENIEPNEESDKAELMHQLEMELRQCEENEDYEQAAEILEQIERLKNSDNPLQ